MEESGSAFLKPFFFNHGPFSASSASKLLCGDSICSAIGLRSGFCFASDSSVRISEQSAKPLLEFDLVLTECRFSDCQTNMARSAVDIRELAGPGASEVIECSAEITYPAGAPNMKHLLHLEGLRRHVSPWCIIRVLRQGGYVGGRSVAETSSGRTTFLVDECRAGSYAVRLGDVTCIAFLVAHEDSHQGHRGSFAPGYSYFLCGQRSAVVQRVVARLDTPETCVVLSRSYSADCESLTSGYGRAARKPIATGHVCDAGQARRSPGAALRAFGVLVSNAAKAQEMIPRVEPCGQCGNTLFGEIRSLVQSTRTSKRDTGRKTSGRNHLQGCKYFAQRFRLVSRYHGDLKLSEQAWFSICPEEISRHIGRRIATLSRQLGRKVRILDPFCGAGGNIIQAARMEEVEHAYAFDIDGGEVECAKRMARLYDVEDKVTVSRSDVFDLEPRMLAGIDAIVTSPPWGGVDYLQGVYDLSSMEPGYAKTLAHLSRFTSNMAILMPRNVAVDQVALSGSAAKSPAAVELELNFLAGKPKTSTIYYGALVNQ